GASRDTRGGGVDIVGQVAHFRRAKSPAIGVDRVPTTTPVVQIDFPRYDAVAVCIVTSAHLFEINGARNTTFVVTRSVVCPNFDRDHLGALRKRGRSAYQQCRRQRGG